MRALAALVLTILFPGVGHLVLRRYLRGAVLALLFAVSAQVLLVEALVWRGMLGEPVAMLLLAVLAGVWLYGLVDVILRLRRTSAAGFQERKDDLLKQAQVAWLKDDNAISERILRQILALDDRDVEAWVVLGEVLKSSGRADEARTCFRTALNLDGSGRWHWSLLYELGAVRIEAPEAEAS